MVIPYDLEKKNLEPLSIATIQNYHLDLKIQNFYSDWIHELLLDIQIANIKPIVKYIPYIGHK